MIPQRPSRPRAESVGGGIGRVRRGAGGRHFSGSARAERRSGGRETAGNHKGAFDMNFAAEGGYQAFHLGGTEWFWLFFSVATAVLALVVGLTLVRGVLAADRGTPKMIEIAEAIQEGAMAYLRRQFKTIAVILVPLAIIVFAT